MSASLRMLFVLLGGAALAAAQNCALPAEMVANFASERTWAEEYYLPVPQEGAFVSARLTFVNSSPTDRRVNIKWWFQAPGALPRSAHESIDVPFRPTAIARRAGTSAIFYVVGWDEDAEQVVAESWTMPADFQLASGEPEKEGQIAPSTFSHAPFAREVVWKSEVGSVEPVWDAVCQPFSNQLLLLPRGTPTRILSVDLGTKELVELYSSTDHPALAGHRTIAISRHPPTGMVAMSSQRKQWEHGRKMKPSDNYFLMYDANSDGLFESTGTTPINELYILLPPDWDERYGESSVAPLPASPELSAPPR